LGRQSAGVLPPDQFDSGRVDLTPVGRSVAWA